MNSQRIHRYVGKLLSKWPLSASDEPCSGASRRSSVVATTSRGPGNIHTQSENIPASYVCQISINSTFKTYQLHPYTVRLCQALRTTEGFSSILYKQGEYPRAYVRYSRALTERLDEKFPYRFIWRWGPVEWPPRSPDLTLLEFHLWGHLKFGVCAVEECNFMYLEERTTIKCSKKHQHSRRFLWLTPKLCRLRRVQ
jgi:hypothetical protein